MANGTYDKWECPEDYDTAFEKVKSGEWNALQFETWYFKTQSDLERDLMAGEGL